MTPSPSQELQIELAILYTKLAKIPYKVKNNDTDEWEVNDTWLYLVRRHLTFSLNDVPLEDITSVFLETVKKFNHMYEDKMDIAKEYGLRLP